MRNFKEIEYNPISGWIKMSDQEKEKVFAFSKKYIDFMNEAKTEREITDLIISMAEEKGFVDFDNIIKNKGKVEKGMKIYSVISGKALILCVVGNNIEDGLRIIGSHLDSPRLDFKPMPLYEDGGFALAKTHYYGGIKKYQWVAIPLAMHGVVIKKDGTKINISVGEKDTDPVFTVSDLLPHLSQDQLKKEASAFIPGENLNVFLGSIPIQTDEDSKEINLIKKNILAFLFDEYGITERDFASAEIEIVPAFKAQEVGFDRGLIGAYAQDDRICAYTSLMAMFDMDGIPDKTCICYLSDKEEIGSVGITGARSNLFETFIYELSYAFTQDSNPLIAKRAMKASRMLSADVTAGFDPNYPEVSDKTNSSYIGRGISIEKYTGSRGKSGASDANPEFIAEFTQLLSESEICWQIGEMGKIDLGGGGTIAQYMADIGIEVLDCGAPVLSMHSPFEITSKIDLYSSFKAYKCFFENM